MARKDVLRYQLAKGQSLAGSITSPVTMVKFTDNVAYQIDITTTDSTGVFSLQGSADYDEQNGNVLNPGHWTDLPLGGTGFPSATGVNDTILINLSFLPFHAIRLRYTPTILGSGTCDIWINAKQVGG